jgi:hypothetical protein
MSKQFRFIRTDIGSKGLKRDMVSNLQLKFVFAKPSYWDVEFMLKTDQFEKSALKVVDLCITGVANYFIEFDENEFAPEYAMLYSIVDDPVYLVILGYKMKKPDNFIIAEARYDLASAIKPCAGRLVYVANYDIYNVSSAWESSLVNCKPTFSFTKSELLKHCNFLKNKNKNKENSIVDFKTMSVEDFVKWQAEKEGGGIS